MPSGQGLQIRQNMSRENQKTTTQDITLGGRLFQLEHSGCAGTGLEGQGNLLAAFGAIVVESCSPQDRQ